MKIDKEGDNLKIRFKSSSKYRELTKDQPTGMRCLPTYWNKLKDKEKIQWVNDFMIEDKKGDYDGEDSGF